MTVNISELGQIPASADALHDARSHSVGFGMSRNGKVSEIPNVRLDGKRFTNTDDPTFGSSLAIAVDPVALITTECITVTCAMRKNARWAQSSVSAILGGSTPRQLHTRASPARPNILKTESRRQSGTVPFVDGSAMNDDDSLASRWGLRGKRGKSLQDNPLMSAFARLRSDLRGCTGSMPRMIRYQPLLMRI